MNHGKRRSDRLRESMSWLPGSMDIVCRLEYQEKFDDSS